MTRAFEILLWFRALAIAADLGPPLAFLLAELELYGPDIRPRVKA